MTKPRVFIAEDDESTAALLTHIMKREEFEVLHAPDGREAANIIKTMPPPDIAFLDLLMPFKDGFHLLKDIRNSPQWKDVKVVMLTSKTDEKDVVRALDAGADDYMTKPFNPQELLARIRRYMRNG